MDTLHHGPSRTPRHHRPPPRQRGLLVISFFGPTLETHLAQGLHTLLTATLYPTTPYNPQPLYALLAEQVAVRLW